jgi:hypothetical protein
MIGIIRDCGRGKGKARKSSNKKTRFNTKVGPWNNSQVDTYRNIVEKREPEKRDIVSKEAISTTDMSIDPDAPVEIKRGARCSAQETTGIAENVRVNL